jgi:DNA-directed RNA polymerase specialized sigma24 family protein
LDELTIQERDALLRFYALGQTPEQVHQATGISVPELRQLRSKIRAQYRKLEARGGNH